MCSASPSARSRLRAVAGALERLETPPERPGPAPIDTGWGPGAPRLERGAVHEWFGDEPPLGLFGALGRRAPGGRVVWIGRDCWAHADPARLWLERSVFVDPGTAAERLWAIDQALRCPGVSCLVADGSGIDMAGSRRLQLAARAGGTLGLLARPPDEIRTLSAARTRWRVGPAPNPDARWYPEPRWTVELLRCKGMQPLTDARRWIVRHCHDTGDVTLVPDAADRRLAPTPGALRLA